MLAVSPGFPPSCLTLERRGVSSCATARRIFTKPSRFVFPSTLRPRSSAGDAGPLEKGPAEKTLIRQDQLPSSELESDSPPAQRPGIWDRLKYIFFGGNIDKAKIQALGIGAVIAYGFVSNVNYGTCLVVAWLAHVKSTGLTPLAPGQWSGFLAICAGMFAVQNFMRPIRFAVAVALTPGVNRAMDYIQRSWGLTKPQAFGILMVSLAVGTTSTIVLCLWLGGGFPAAPATV